MIRKSRSARIPFPAGFVSDKRELRLIVDTIPGLVAIMSPRGEVELVNQQGLDYFGMRSSTS